MCTCRVILRFKYLNHEQCLEQYLVQSKQDMLDVITVINYQYYYIKGTFTFAYLLMSSGYFSSKL